MGVKKKSGAKIVVIGGGTGVFTLLSGLKNHFNHLTAIVTMSDDGGSTGILREDFGILPPGDVRRALMALSHTDNKTLSTLWSYRFAEGSGLAGHSIGNLMITALERLTGNFEYAIAEASKMLAVKGDVIPVTLTPTRLFAKLEDGTVVKGETNIDIPHHNGRLKIESVWLEPAVAINPAAKEAVMKADLVIIGPGDLYTSLLPNILAHGMPEALSKTKAKIIYMTNLMTKFGETDGFQASDFFRTMESYVGANVIDYVAVNTKKPSAERLKPYILEKAVWVEHDAENFKRAKSGKPIILETDLARPRGFVRHDSEKTAQLMRSLV